MIMHPYTWKYEMGYDLYKVRHHICQVNATGLEKDFEDASAWLERFWVISAFTVRRLAESRHLNIDHESYFSFIEEVVIDGSDGYIYNRNTGLVNKKEIG